MKESRSDDDWDWPKYDTVVSRVFGKQFENKVPNSGSMKSGRTFSMRESMTSLENVREFFEGLASGREARAKMKIDTKTIKNLIFLDKSSFNVIL
jgi:hypothetical protein